MDEDLETLLDDYEIAREAFEAGKRDGFPGGDRDELKEAADAAFARYDRKLFVQTQREAFGDHLEFDENLNAVNIGVEPTVHDDGEVG